MAEEKTLDEWTLFDLMERAAKSAAAAVPAFIKRGEAVAAAELLNAATGATELLQRAALDWARKDGDK